MKKEDDLERQFPLHEILEENNVKLNAALSEKMLQHIRTSYYPKPVPIRIVLLRYSAIAACILGVIVAATGLYPKKTQLSPIVKATNIESKDTAPSLVKFRNTTATIISSKLPDGSSVQLHPNSSIEYLPAFERTARSVYIKGKAVFSVAKDATRPFTVYTPGMSVTALGTSFIVSEGRVKLIDGKIKVSVRSNINESIILLPGEHLRLEKGHLKKYLAENVVERQRIKFVANSLSFKNHCLKDVFKRIETKFSVTIKDETQENLSQKLFTGKFLEQDSLDFILKTICAMYGTQYEIEGNIVFISR